mmetsp:Transcript_4804/g.9882  ORF Transcript_4804/g.9882 Transcript_4804/m.9882 type:complete len:233 (-) Transcript_4804:743-1441(-)
MGTNHRSHPPRQPRLARGSPPLRLSRDAPSLLRQEGGVHGATSAAATSGRHWQKEQDQVRTPRPHLSSRLRRRSPLGDRGLLAVSRGLAFDFGYPSRRARSGRRGRGRSRRASRSSFPPRRRSRRPRRSRRRRKRRRRQIRRIFPRGIPPPLCLFPNLSSFARSSSRSLAPVGTRPRRRRVVERKGRRCQESLRQRRRGMRLVQGQCPRRFGCRSRCSRGSFRHRHSHRGPR